MPPSSSTTITPTSPRHLGAQLPIQHESMPTIQSGMSRTLIEWRKLRPNNFVLGGWVVSGRKVMLKPIICALTKSLGVAGLLACLFSSRAHADVGVILNETLNESVARVTGSGHTAVYFSRICPDGPVKLRLCRPGENGSVMSNYIHLGEDEVG